MMTESEKLISNSCDSDPMLLQAPSRPDIPLNTMWHCRDGVYFLVRKEKDHDYWRKIE